MTVPISKDQKLYYFRVWFETKIGFVYDDVGEQRNKLTKQRIAFCAEHVGAQLWSDFSHIEPLGQMTSDEHAQLQKKKGKS